jgi:hypothetical protein
MLHVKIDLVPFGQEEGRRQILDLYIANVGRISPIHHEYHVWCEDPRGVQPRPEPLVSVDHMRDDGAWILVKKCIEALEHNGKVPG